MKTVVVFQAGRCMWLHIDPETKYNRIPVNAYLREEDGILDGISESGLSRPRRTVHV
jgi:hypothetical protein